MGGSGGKQNAKSNKQAFDDSFSSFQKSAVGIATPPAYEPPYFTPQNIGDISCGFLKCNVTHRAPIGAAPPCCFAQGLVCCAKAMFAPWCKLDVFRMSDPDEAFKKLLASCNPDCPDMMKGVWWMQDSPDANIIVTFHEADWSSTKKSATKQALFNWSADYGTCQGALTIVSGCAPQHIEVSEDGKWICFLAPGYSRPQFAYVMQPGDVLRKPNGEVVSCDPGDWVRVNYSDSYNPSSTVALQYRVRRIAYYDEFGALVKTDAYDEYVKSAKAPLPHEGCCCNYFFCGLSNSEIAEDFQAMSDEQAIIYYPAAVTK